MDEMTTKRFNALRLILYKKYGVALQRIHMDATLSEMGLDSLAVLELAFDIEDAFRIESFDERQLGTITLAQLMINIHNEAAARRAA
jgi:acyl carrier protein